jgi:hypothetical protein
MWWMFSNPNVGTVRENNLTSLRGRLEHVHYIHHIQSAALPLLCAIIITFLRVDLASVGQGFLRL